MQWEIRNYKIVMNMETKILNFTVDPEGVIELARQRYWFENSKKHGVSILRCFIGIESYQITRILEGDATLKEDDIGRIYYSEIPDEEFKKQLKDYLDYQKRKANDPDLVCIGGCFIHKDLVDEYAGHVVKRLRESMRNTANGIMLEFKDMEEILCLETRRQEMHDAILHDAGFDREDSSEEACEFRTALSDYVDKLAGKLFKDRDSPDMIMDPEEIALKKKQSDDIVSYMDNLNLMMAKQRGLI
jgi:hypothetical protein